MANSARYDSLYICYAEQYSLSWIELKAQGLAESNLDPNAVSPVGAMGLMQFMPPTFAEWSDKLGLKNANPYNPEHSIHCAAAYMRWLIDQMAGDIERAWAAYNWGIGNVTRYCRAGNWREELPDETKKYIARIRSFIG